MSVLLIENRLSGFNVRTIRTDPVELIIHRFKIPILMLKFAINGSYSLVGNHDNLRIIRDKYMRSIKNFKRILPALLLSGAVFTVSMQGYAETRRALLVGISDYGNPDSDPERWSNISGANDIGLLAPRLESQGFSITTLTDSRATYAGIVKEIKKLIKKCKKGDTVYLHFSTHGQPFEDLDGDEADGWDEAIIPVDASLQYSDGIYEGENHLLDDELEAYINEIRSKLGTEGRLFVVLDACHSGTASRAPGDHIRGVREGFTRSGIEYFPDTSAETNEYFPIATAPGQSPVTFIEACRSYQVNREVRDPETDIWYGSVSYYIARTLDSIPLDREGSWIDSVRKGMSADRHLRRQNMVIESSRLAD